MSKIALAVALLLTFALYGIAFAHATVLSCDPPIGANLTTAPTRFVCDFSEPLLAQSSSLSIVNARGERVDKNDTHSVSGVASKLAVSLDPTRMENGLYTLRWTVTSTIDAGQTQGEFQFGINTIVPPTPTPALYGSPITPQNFYTQSAPSELIARFMIALGVVVLGAIGFMIWRMRRAANALDEQDTASE